MNNIREIAESLGVELGEKFLTTNSCRCYWFEKTGLFEGTGKFAKAPADMVLAELLSGARRITKREYD